MDGPISAFHQKLVAKGFKHDAVTSKGLKNGRAFTGTFFGKKANLYVFYIPTTKVVAGLNISLQDYDGESDYAQINRVLAKKYPEAEITEEDFEDKTTYTLDEGYITVSWEIGGLYVMFYDDANAEKYQQCQDEEYMNEL